MKNHVMSVLEDQTVESALILPYKNSPDVTMHLDLQTRDGHLLISGEAMDVSDGGEAFYLVGTEFDLRSWWAECWASDWKPRDLVADWKGMPLEAVWKGPRALRFFYDPEDRRLGLPPQQGIFESAAAIEISAQGAGTQAVVVLYASTDCTFSVEIATVAERQQEILGLLTEFRPSLNA